MIYVNLIKEERLKVINKLKNWGFKEKLDNDYIVDCPFPFAVDFDKKLYTCLTTATQAAIVTADKKVINKENFFQLIESFKLDKN